MENLENLQNGLAGFKIKFVTQNLDKKELVRLYASLEVLAMKAKEVKKSLLILYPVQDLQEDVMNAILKK